MRQRYGTRKMTQERRHWRNDARKLKQEANTADITRESWHNNMTQTEQHNVKKNTKK